MLNAPKVSGLDFNLRVALALMAVAVIFVSVYPALSDWVKLKSLPVPRQCISLCLNGRYCEAQALTLQALQKREYITYSLDDDLDLARSCLILGNYEEARKIAVSVSQSLTEPAVSDVDKFRIDRGRSLQVEALICLQQYDKALVILNSIQNLEYDWDFGAQRAKALMGSGQDARAQSALLNLHPRLRNSYLSMIRLRAGDEAAAKIVQTEVSNLWSAIDNDEVTYNLEFAAAYLSRKGFPEEAANIRNFSRLRLCR